MGVVFFQISNIIYSNLRFLKVVLRTHNNNYVMCLNSKPWKREGFSRKHSVVLLE